MTGNLIPHHLRHQRGPVSERDPTAAEPESGEFTNLGVEEEFQVIDLETRSLVAKGPELLEHLPAATFTAELHRSVVESQTVVCQELSALRGELVRSRHALASVASQQGLGVVASGTVPLVDPLRVAITETSRYRQMLEDYQLLVREQLICGAQVHVQLSDRDLAVAIAQRVAPYLPVLLAISASSPFWMGEDSGYASMRSLVWQRWPTAGLSAELSTAAEHDALVADLVASGTISDAGMIYFDVRPSAHVPTLELRVTDACPDVDDVVLVAGLFRALVRRERAAIETGSPWLHVAAPVLRAATWRAARSGLEGDLLDLPRSPRPVPAPVALTALLGDLRPYLDDCGDWPEVSALAARALARGSSAAQQRRAYQRRGRLADVVDLLLDQTRSAVSPTPRSEVVPGSGLLRLAYQASGDEVFTGGGTTPAYNDMLRVLHQLGPVALRRREMARDEEQRSRGVTFGVAGEASTWLFPVDLVPRVVSAPEWTYLRAGLEQRARALDAFLHDVYSTRQVVRDGVIPADVVTAAPGLRSSGASMGRQAVRAVVCGMDLVRDARGRWHVLEDNLRVPSGLGYAVQNRRLTDAIMPDLPPPPGLLDVEAALPMLAETLSEVAPAAAGDAPQVLLLSEGPEGPAWFEHRMLGEAMGVPVATTREVLVEDGEVFLLRLGVRQRVDVLYLRIDEENLLHSTGADGHPLGHRLLAAADAGRVTMANALGNGVADDKAIYAYVPRLIEYYLGESPHLPAVPTYRCAVPDQLEAVLARLDQLVVKPVDGYGGEGVLVGPVATDEELAVARRQVLAAPHRWIAQDTIGLSTHPVFDGVRLSPRHVDLRAFVFLGDRPRVAPAALTRVAPAGSMVVNSSRGGGSKDSWLLG